MRLPQVKTKTILLGGGLDIETPMMAVGEGFALEADNFEANLNGGYRRMLGYERLDGRVKPSDAVYYTLTVASAEFLEVDDVITGSSSDATAVIVSIDFGNNIIGVTNLVGEFEVDEAVGVTTVVVPQSANNYPDTTIGAQWELDAQNYYRNLIQPVPGVGSVLGVWFWDGDAYAFRSDEATACMYKSTTTGWLKINFDHLLSFDTGVLAEGDVVEGDTLTGLTSTATATVKRFIKVSGAYGSTAAGYMVVEMLTGTFQTGEAIQKSATTVFNADGANQQISFTLGDNKFEFVNANFSGSPDTFYMYGCDGVNNGFQFDGTVLTPILTGSPAPSHVETHNNHLFFGVGSSLINSVVQQPLVFNAILGSAEIAVGDSIRGLKSVGGDALMVSTDRGVKALYGQNVDDFVLQNISIDAGDAGNTLEVIGAPMLVTARGLQRIDPTDRFGNFESATLSRRINPLLRRKLSISNVVGASIVRDKNQYRIYFADGSGITLTSDQLYGEMSLPAFTTFNRTVEPTCLASVAKTGSREIILFGAANGYVYQEEKGFSHDGAAIQYALRLPFHHLGSPMVRKAFKWLDIESDVERTADLRVTYEYSDGAGHTASSPIRAYQFQGGSRAYWDEADWEEFNWDDELVSRENLSLNGTGHNISVLFFGISAITAPFTINAITYQFLPRRLRRGQ